MNSADEIKKTVKEKYSKIAKQYSSSGCCGSSELVEFSVMKDDYTDIEGYVKEADLDLGCGLPTQFAGIEKGNTVVDLGSGAGNDVFIARSIVGETGKVIGIDFSVDMIDKAFNNKIKLGFENVDFKLGEIENIPLNSEIADVVVSNCVLNLVPDKNKAFSEIYRILKPNGHFCISDIVSKGKLPDEFKKSAELYAGCVSGAIEDEKYLNIIKNSGFKNIEIKKSKTINLPEEILIKYLSQDEINSFKKKDIGLFSITVVGYK